MADSWSKAEIELALRQSLKLIRKLNRRTQSEGGTRSLRGITWQNHSHLTRLFPGSYRCGLIPRNRKTITRVLTTCDVTGFQRNAVWLSTLHATARCDRINQISQPIRRVCGWALPGSALLSQRNEYVYNLIHEY